MERSSSLINSKIREFYITQPLKTKNENEKYFFNDNGLNFKLIFQRVAINTPASSPNYEDYLNCYQKLLPIYLGCVAIIEKQQIHELNLEWLGGANVAYFKEDFEADETDTVQQILLLTSMLEYGLGSVYYTCKACQRPPPHLLRDLINTTELEDIFGTEAIFFLRVLLGTPNSINLRNIVWHGFPKPDEVPSYYVAVLLLTIHSLGSQLITKQFRISHRPQIQDFSSQLMEIGKQFLKNSNGVLKYESIPFSCSFLSAQHKQFWKKIWICYKNKKYWQLVVLILPQIELILRHLYGKANNCDISATLDEYYITIDTIFEDVVPSVHTNNKLICNQDIVSQNALNCLYDLFIAPHGPRLRDKVSHGEAHLAAINSVHICDTLMYLSFALMTNGKHFFTSDYECKFHMNSMARNAIFQAAVQLENFVNENTAIRANFDGNICDAEIFKQLRISKPGIFARPQKEPELMLLILKISKLCCQTCSNYTTTLEERFELLFRRELHSKRRRTLEQLLAAVPKICETLSQILQTMADIFIKANSSKEDLFGDVEKCSKLSRFLRLTLKVSENLAKYSDTSSNEWLKALELCQKFKESRDRTFGK